MKLLQFSTAACPPCRASRALVKELGASKEIYSYLDIHEPGVYQAYKDILIKAGLKSVPLFVLLKEDGSIEEHWTGFSSAKIRKTIKELEGSNS